MKSAILRAVVLAAAVFAFAVIPTSAKAVVPSADTVGRRTQVYYLSEHDRTLMAKVLWNEAGAASYKCKLYCASVMFNQLDSPYWGDSISEILSRPNAYTGYTELYKAEGQDLTECYKAVDEICKYGSQLPSYVWYFDTKKFQWDGIRVYAEIDGVKFQYFTQEKRSVGYH